MDSDAPFPQKAEPRAPAAAARSPHTAGRTARRAGVHKVRRKITHILVYTAYVKNLTLAIDENLLLEARKLALDEGTSVNEMVREYLARIVRERGGQQAARRRLERAMEEGAGRVRGTRWTRERLHQR
jgi:CRISPR/Cas system-associated protein Csm6